MTPGARLKALPSNRLRVAYESQLRLLPVTTRFSPSGTGGAIRRCLETRSRRVALAIKSHPTITRVPQHVTIPAPESYSPYIRRTWISPSRPAMGRGAQLESWTAGTDRMPQASLVYRILVASPSDCVHERKAIPEVISLWNALNSSRTAAILEPVLWETHARPELGDRPQAIINKQIVENCDILVGAFWTRLGTHTGAAESGTVEEIEEFRSAGKPVLLYFSSAPVVPESIDEDQYRRLREYREKIKAEGIVFSYDTLAEFRDLLLRHLSATLGVLHSSGSIPAHQPRPNPSDESDERKTVRIFKENFAAFVRRLDSEWASERDSGPHDTDEGRSIMRNARFEVLNFRSQVVKDVDGRLKAALEQAMRRIRELEKHQLYMDGGLSFGKFWALGDGVIDSLNDANSILESGWGGDAPAV